MEKIILKITCSTGHEMEWQKLVSIQGDIKTLHPTELEKALNSFKQDGFHDPLNVWEDKKNKQWVIIGGNQRVKVLTKAKQLGWQVPTKVPVAIVFAETLKEAKRKLLEQASTLGRTNQSEITLFAEEAGIPQTDMDKVTSFFDSVKPADIPISDETKKKTAEEVKNAKKDTTVDEHGVIKLPILKKDEVTFHTLLTQAIEKKGDVKYPYLNTGILMELLERYIKKEKETEDLE